MSGQTLPIASARERADSLFEYAMRVASGCGDITELPDGRFDIVTVGRRRFKVLTVATGSAPYLTAEVEWLSDDEGGGEAADQLAPRVLAAFRAYLDLLRPASDALDAVPDDPTVLSHLVAASAQLTTDERQLLLAAPDTATRLRSELKLLTREAGLLARVRALLRRLTPETVDVGGVRMELSGRRVLVDGVEVNLANKEFELLRVLMVRAGQVVTREEILREVWNDPDLKTSKTLDMHMSWLRRKIGGERRIATVRGVGFRFNHD